MHTFTVRKALNCSSLRDVRRCTKACAIGSSSATMHTPQAPACKSEGHAKRGGSWVLPAAKASATDRSFFLCFLFDALAPMLCTSRAELQQLSLPAALTLMPANTVPHYKSLIRPRR